MLFSRKNVKESLIVILTYSKKTYAEITKNYLIEEILLNKILKREKSNFVSNDFTFMTFVNDQEKIFRVIFQIDVKKNNKKVQELITKLCEQVFECKDVFIVEKNQIADVSEFCRKYEINYSDISSHFQGGSKIQVRQETNNKLASKASAHDQVDTNVTSESQIRKEEVRTISNEPVQTVTSLGLTATPNEEEYE